MRTPVVMAIFFIRLRLLPNVDPVLAVMEWGYRHMVESGQLADIRQPGFDRIRVVWLFGLFQCRIVFVRGCVLSHFLCFLKFAEAHELDLVIISGFC